MSWYQRSRFVYNSFKNSSSKLIPRNPIHPPNPRINPNNSSSCCNNKHKSFSVFGSPSISSKLGFSNSNGIKLNQNSLFSGVFRRNYYVDRNQVYHFKPRGYKKWIQNPRNMFIIIVLGTGAGITVYFGNSEVIPYTKRKHFVLLSRSLERQIGEHQFNEMKKSFKGKILPAIHPESVRVRLIAKDIIEALQRGLSHERVWSDPGYASESVGRVEIDGGEETLKALSGAPEGGVDGDWRKQDEVLDDSWVKDSRKEGGKSGAKVSTAHLEGMKWEVLVVNEPVVNAFCMPGGKIVVFTGLLNNFKTDAEVATIIGHEVGHAIARHSAEQITRNMWFAILHLVLYQFITPDLVNAMSTLLLRLPFSRKMEIEADYIGLLLTASAGYDPRVAPKVYEKLGQLSGESSLRDYLSTHPSGKTRAQLLARAQVMTEALGLYREAIGGHEIEGFL
ncbi:mitochondrial metalloendopeptidase OMA1 [Silene latifolia]|uniref:mitochondrial metalloendopeptidase OMA1 n=1 Tax=Silene latifolia TaxID=37657 RepID=UPI003D77F82B